MFALSPKLTLRTLLAAQVVFAVASAALEKTSSDPDSTSNVVGLLALAMLLFYVVGFFNLWRLRASGRVPFLIANAAALLPIFNTPETATTLSMSADAVSTAAAGLAIGLAFFGMGGQWVTPRRLPHAAPDLPANTTGR